MAVYKIFPTQDATLYSLFPQMNTGLDPIVEATTTAFGPSNPYPHTSRFLIQFSTPEIEDVINNKVSGSDWQANLRLFLSTVTGLSQETYIVTNPVAKEWVNGTGQYLDQPITRDGCSWEWANYTGSAKWGVTSLPSNATASYTSSVTPGGGIWYYTSSNDNYPNVKSSQSFSLYDDKDLNFDVTSTVHNWYSESLSNYGFIVRQTESQEFLYTLEQQVELKYFSIDTNTIYPPLLEIKWDDFSYITSSNISEINTSEIQLSLNENPGIFYSESINRFRINCRPKYPARTFSTSSSYSTNYYLPSGSSMWAIKDLYTNEFVVNFDSNYTQISSDPSSSYFDVYMNGLQPERWYKILIQTTIGNSTKVMDDNYTFKVVNG